MESAAIAAVVGGLISFVLERVPAAKKWLGEIPMWADAAVLAAVFYVVPLALSFAACQGYTLPIGEVTCAADKNAVATLVLNSTVALLSSQLWHGYVNARLKEGNSGEVG